MALNQNVVKFVYEGVHEDIFYSPDATIDEILESARQRFGIAKVYKDHIKVSYGGRHALKKKAFQRQLTRFPSPKIEFHIFVDYKDAVRTMHGKFYQLRLEGMEFQWPVQSCVKRVFLETEQVDNADEPMPKRDKTDLDEVTSF